VNRFPKISAISLEFLVGGALVAAAGGIIGVVLGLPSAFLFRNHEVGVLEVPLLIGYAVGLAVYLWFNDHVKDDA
jgi:hypothetical protein